MLGIRLTPALVQSVRDAADIVDVASDLTSPKRRGRKYVALCPFHKEKTPSFQIDPDLGLYHCFGCGVGGDAIDLHMRSSGDDFPAAIEALAARWNVPVEFEEGAAPRRDLSNVLESAHRFFRDALRGASGPRGYLAERQISDELQDRFGLGFAPDSWHDLLDRLRREISEDDLLAAGLVGRSERTGKLYDRFRNRLMFPIHAPSGKLVGFGGRTLGDDRAKYVNTAETDAFHKSHLLYALHGAKRTLRDEGRAVLAEGYFDVVGLVASGVEGAVAGMGTSLTADQAKLLARYCDEVVLAYDGDDAGRAAAARSLPILLAAGLSVRRAVFPAGHDPDSLRLAEGPEAVREVIADATDAIDEAIAAAIGDGSSLAPRQQSQAAGVVRELLAPLRDPLERAAYGRRAAQRLGVPESVVLERGGAVAWRAPSRSAQSEVRSEEEKALVLLFDERQTLPPAERLPDPQVFLDRESRNIFTVFRDLYSRESVAPSRREVVQALADTDSAVDLAARILLQETVPEESGSLAATLAALDTRWQKRRQAELLSEIRRAQSDGDPTRLAELLEEKKILSRRQHPAMTGRLW